MDFQEVLMLASATHVQEVVPAPKGLAYAKYLVPDYPYAGGSGSVSLHAVCDQGEVLFVDCGPRSMTDRTWFSRVLDQFADSPEQTTLFMTHLHRDHVGEAGWFASQGVKGVISASSAQLASMDPAECERAFGTLRYDLPFGVADYCHENEELWESLGQVQLAQDWDLIAVGDRKFEVMPLPGHEIGQCGLISKDKTLLFSGDCLCKDPSLFSWTLDHHDAAAAMEAWSGLLAYSLEWVVTAHDGFFEGEEETRTLIKDQIAGVDSRAKDILGALRDARSYTTPCDFMIDKKGESSIIDTAMRGKHLNMLQLGQYLAYFEFLYDYEKVHRCFDDDGCAVYEPARFSSFFM